MQRALADKLGSRVRRCRPADPAVRIRRLPEQRGHVAGQAAGQATARGRRPDRRRAGRSAGDRDGRGQRPWLHQPDPARQLDRRPGESSSSPTRGWGCPQAEPAAARRGGLLRSERGQGTARRAPARDSRGRRDRPGARAPRPRRHPGGAPGRLGHPVRHAHRARARRRRAGHLRRAGGRRVHRLLPGRPGEVRRRRRASRTGPGSGSSSCRPESRRRSGSGSCWSTTRWPTCGGSTPGSASR